MTNLKKRTVFISLVIMHFSLSPLSAGAARNRLATTVGSYLTTPTTFRGLPVYSINQPTKSFPTSAYFQPSLLEKNKALVNFGGITTPQEHTRGQEQIKAQKTIKQTLSEKLEKLKKILKESQTKSKATAKKKLQDYLDVYIKSVHEDPVLAFEKAERMGREKKKAKEKLKSEIAALMAEYQLGFYASKYLKPKKSVKILPAFNTSVAPSSIVIQQLSPAVKDPD